MKNKSRKILSLVAAATLLGATLSFAGCGGDYYEYAGVAYSEADKKAVAESNGGFAVEKGDYVYFINGVEANTASNEFGEVTKGALMRIKKTDLSGAFANNTSLVSKAETVVPMLFVAQNYDAGIYIYGDYVYYATPTSDKNMKGEVENTWIDFKRAKLDGKETMKDYFFRVSDNATNYRFVKEGEVVYCLYEEGGALKSYNTSNGKTHTLVSGASSEYFYDTSNPENPNVYYTMAVTYNIDSAQSTTATYNQVYCVNAASTATVNADNASYTVKVGGKDYRTYKFNKGYLESKNEETEKKAKLNNTEPTGLYDFEDYSTYPYVNLGTLVLDGVGSKCEWSDVYNNKAEVNTPKAELQGYTYTLSRYENGGVYFMRKQVAENTNLYYLKDKATTNAIAANTAVQIVANSTTNASDTALFNVTAEGKHEYIYVSGSTIYKASPDANGVDKAPIAIANGVSDATLWTVEGNYLYYYGAGTSGNKLSRVDVTGEAKDYKDIFKKEEYQPVTIAYVDFNSSWYKPEFVGGVMLYSDAQAIEGTSYNYIAAANVGDSVSTADLVKANEDYQATKDEIAKYSQNSILQDLMTYYFRTGKTAVAETWALYDEYQQEKFTEFKNGNFKLESAFVKAIGKVSSADQEAIDAAWAASLLVEEESSTTTASESGLNKWVIVAIVAAGVIVLAAAIVIPVVVVNKKAAQRRAREATVNAYKRKKIDTTDDKTIDVYADDEAEATEPAETENGSEE